MTKKDKEKEERKKQRKQQKLEKLQLKKAFKSNDFNDNDNPITNINTILQEYESKKQEIKTVIIENCIQPSPRIGWTITNIPGTNESFCFGGSYWNGQINEIYNDLYKWNIEKNEWKKIQAINTPSPRCFHQAIIYNEKLYIFGGEYSTLHQFFHYKDLWYLDMKTFIWTEVISINNITPSARSGHRMILWRNCIVLFGGFYEALHEMKWFNDCYIFSLHNEKWLQLSFKPNTQIPRPRSGHQMIVSLNDDVLYIYGGYSKDKASLANVNSPQELEKKQAKIHDDLWCLSLKSLLPLTDITNDFQASSIDISKLIWQKIAKKGQFPSLRCGMSSISFKNKLVIFGGVFDEEGPRHSIQSTFYNSIYSFDMELRRWFLLFKGNEESKLEEAGDDSLNDTIEAIGDLNIKEESSINPDSANEIIPSPRINTCLQVKGNYLYVIGGLAERGDVEVTMDDIWMYDLHRQKPWRNIAQGTMQELVWKGEDLENETDGTRSETNDNSDSDSDSSDDEEDHEDEEDEDDNIVGGDQKIPYYYPASHEPLKDYFDRTFDYWSEKVIQQHPVR